MLPDIAHGVDAFPVLLLAAALLSHRKHVREILPSPFAALGVFAPAASATGGAVAPRTFDGARIMRYCSVGAASPKFFIAKPQSLYLSIPYGEAPIPLTYSYKGMYRSI